MALREVWRVSTGNPSGNSAWSDQGDPISFAAQTATTTANANYANPGVCIIPQVDKFLADGSNPGVEMSTTTSPIQSLKGAQVTFATVLAPSTTLTFGLRVMRQIGTLAVALTNGTTYTTVSLKAPGLLQALPEDQTLTVTNQSGSSNTLVTAAANGSISAGSTVFGIDSQNPTNTCAIGDPVYGFIGATAPTSGVGTNGIVCGYVGTGAAGGGSPLFPIGASLVLSMISTASNVVTPVTGASYFQLYPGDVIQLVVGAQASTVSVPACTIQPLIA